MSLIDQLNAMIDGMNPEVQAADQQSQNNALPQGLEPYDPEELKSPFDIITLLSLMGKDLGSGSGPLSQKIQGIKNYPSTFTREYPPSPSDPVPISEDIAKFVPSEDPFPFTRLPADSTANKVGRAVVFNKPMVSVLDMLNKLIYTAEPRIDLLREGTLKAPQRIMDISAYRAGRDVDPNLFFQQMENDTRAPWDMTRLQDTSRIRQMRMRQIENDINDAARR